MYSGIKTPSLSIGDQDELGEIDLRCSFEGDKEDFEQLDAMCKS